MVFYNRSFVASGKETERQRLIMPSYECFINVYFCILQRWCLVLLLGVLLCKLRFNLLHKCHVVYLRVLLSAGVSSLISLLTSAREEDQPKLNVLLCEAVVAVYLSLLIHGLGTHSSNELFRLAAHPLNNRVWAAVFGGGAKVIIKPKRPEAPPGTVIVF